MEIEKAGDLGFCFGVRRAIKLLEEAAQEQGPLQTLGPIVHNQQVVEELKTKGIRVASGLHNIDSEIVAIASHGATPQVIDMLNSRGLKVIDATCPLVQRAQRAARRLAAAGFYVLVFGDSAHTEVQGILGWAGDNALATLELPKLEMLPRRVGILSQTTQNPSHFARFLQQFIASGMASLSELRIINTICEVTTRRQQAALELARRVDLMLVIGGRHSANTRHLAESCVAAGVETHHVETVAELDPAWLANRHRIGVTAGASTPDQVIDEVIARLEEMAQCN
jgi:4-hydroxy-3-methylbut-2-enyl diphosphate reductase